jgi:hypothetical protein
MTHAPILSILSVDDDYIPWFVTNYLPFRVFTDGFDFVHYYHDHYCCPYLFTTHMERDFEKQAFSHYNSVERIMKYLDNGYYVVTNIATSLIPLYTVGFGEPAHPILIYGYEETENTFNVADFFKNSAYSFEKLPFQEFELAYLKCDESSFWQKGTTLIKRKEFDKKYTIDMMLSSLRRYIYGYEPYESYNSVPNCVTAYGYNAVSERLKFEFSKWKEGVTIDNRLLPLYCDHTKVLTMFIQYLIDIKITGLKDTQKESEVLLDYALALRNRVIKLQIQGKRERLNLADLEILRIMEEKILYSVLDILQIVNG